MMEYSMQNDGNVEGIIVGNMCLNMCFFFKNVWKCLGICGKVSFRGGQKRKIHESNVALGIDGKML